jgi:transposase-like protein
MVPGASVAGVARRHEVNANQVFVWRRQYHMGQLQPSGSEVSTEGTLAEAGDLSGKVKRVVQRRLPSATAAEPESDFVELELAGGDLVRIHGKAATQFLERLIESLSRR